MRLARRILLCLVVPLVSLPLCAETYDLIIRHASLIDGTGAPARPGDLAIRSGRIAAIGQLPAGSTAPTEIDAAGHVVAPGFIDVHTHSEDVNDLPTAENYHPPRDRIIREEPQQLHEHQQSKNLCHQLWLDLQQVSIAHLKTWY
jgi:cytosine/adenosine deaminase-related metal-dependent hydrolase